MSLITPSTFHRPLLFHSRLLFAGIVLLALIFPPALALAASKKNKLSEEVVRVDMREADKILKYHRPPEYPVEARRRHVTASGKFQLNFGPDGKVKDIAVLQSTDFIILDHACLWALVHWQARHPGEIQAVRVPVTFTIGR